MSAASGSAGALVTRSATTSTRAATPWLRSTNNYFAQLSTAREGSNSVRFGYDAIYKKVTSGTVGRSSDVFTQLGMYWQLHLAYDNYYNFKIFDNYQEQLDNLFYARVDSYARKPASAPLPAVWP